MPSILCWRRHRAPLSVATLVIHMTVDVRNTAKSLPCDDVSCQNTPAFPGQPTQSPVSLYQADEVPLQASKVDEITPRTRYW